MITLILPSFLSQRNLVLMESIARSSSNETAPTTPQLRVKASASTDARIAAVIVLVISLALLITGAYLNPESAGVGTHEQLGLSSCGFLDSFGTPCATCGMTTAVSEAAHGHILRAFYVQPAGALLAVLAMMAVIVASASLVMGFSLAPLGAVIWRVRVVLLAAVFVLIAWVYKIIIVRGGF